MRNKILMMTGVILLSGAGLAKLNAQAPSSQTTTTQTTTRGRQSPETQTTTVQTTTQRSGTEQTFMGKVEKRDDQFVLENKDKKSSYKLDDATKADKFDGDDVKVVGTLDASTNMIHVQSIEKVER